MFKTIHMILEIVLCLRDSSFLRDSSVLEIVLCVQDHSYDLRDSSLS